MKSKILIISLTLLLQTQILLADQAIYTISVVIPSIPGFNTALNTSETSSNFTNNYNFISEEIMRDHQKVVLQTFTED